MLAVACRSRKGGVGKSTLSRLIARTYAAAGWRVKIGDFNVKQKIAVDSAAVHLSQKIDPKTATEAFGSSRSALKSNGFDLMVLDGKPDADMTTLELGREANVIVIPTSPTQDDLIPQIKFANELSEKACMPAIFVINKTTESTVWTEAARVYLSEAGYSVAKTDLRMMTCYQAAQSSGRAISETPFATLNDRAEALAEDRQELPQITGH